MTSAAMSRIFLDIKSSDFVIYKARLWLAAQFLKLVARLAGSNPIVVTYSTDFDAIPRLLHRRTYMMVGNIELPRQCSVRPDSPIYVSTFTDWGPKVDFYLNGIRQDQVVSYDMDIGLMRVLKPGPDGLAFMEWDEIATEIKHGEIEVRLAGEC